MHELSLTKPLVDMALHHASIHKATKITSVTITLGKLSCVTPHAVRWCFNTLCQHTLAQDAELIIEEQTAQGLCLDCGHTFELISLTSPCPKCQSYKLERHGGESFVLKSIAIGQ